MSEPAFKSETAKKRYQQVMEAIDQIAYQDQLAFLTTKKVSQISRISDGVLFRLFASKESMMEAWLDSRGDYLRLALKAMPTGERNLHRLIQRVLNDPILLGFLCCHPMDAIDLRHRLDTYRQQFRRFLHTHIELIQANQLPLTADALSDHLWQSIHRAWNPEDPQANHHKESLMTKLPWEKEQQKTSFPTQETLQRLALNDSGFVFDPESGRSFTANAVGLYVLRFLQNNQSNEDLFTAIEADFDVDRKDAKRDLAEFAAQLRKFLA